MKSVYLKITSTIILINFFSFCDASKNFDVENQEKLILKRTSTENLNTKNKRLKLEEHFESLSLKNITDEIFLPEKALECSDSNSSVTPAIQSLVSSRIHDLLKLGCNYISCNQLQQAIETFTLLLKEPEITNNNRAQALIIRGNAKIGLKLPQEAIKDHEAALVTLGITNDIRAYAIYSRGFAKFAFGHYQEAIEDHDVALAIPEIRDAVRGKALGNRGFAKSMLGYDQEAILNLEESLNFKNALPRLVLSQIYKKLSELYNRPADSSTK